MKTPTLQTGKSALLIFIALLTCIATVFGQSDTLFQAAGPDTALTNKHVVINNTLDVHGKLTVDSMRILGPLYIGDSTLSLHHNVTVLNVKSDHIRSTQGRIALFGDNGAGGYNNNINLGIGVHNPTGKVDLKYDNNGNLKIGVGNRAIYGGNSAGNMHIDCLSPGAIRLNQYVASNIIMATGGGKVGIGIASNVIPASLVHLNAFTANTGFLFLTVGKKNLVNQWQLFTGTNTNNATEKFKIIIPNNSDDVVLQALRPGANLFFKTGGNITRMIIDDGTPGSNTTTHFLLLTFENNNSFENISSI